MARDGTTSIQFARFLEELEMADGGFRGGLWDDRADVEYTFYGLGSPRLALLGQLQHLLETALKYPAWPRLKHAIVWSMNTGSIVRMFGTNDNFSKAASDPTGFALEGSSSTSIPGMPVLHYRNLHKNRVVDDPVEEIRLNDELRPQLASAVRSLNSQSTEYHISPAHCFLRYCS